MDQGKIVAQGTHEESTSAISRISGNRRITGGRIVMKTKKISWKSLRRFIPYLTAYAKDIWLAVILGIINGIATVVMTLQIGQSIDQMIGEGQVRFNRLFHLLILFGGIVLINVVSQWLIQVLSNG